MPNPTSLLVTLTAALAALPEAQAAIYTKNSPVLQVNARNYDKLITKSNYTSIVEFYAPWCGHCQNLKPAYEKAAKNLDGLAQVAAIDCDEESNKQLCGSMGVQGFPTLKIVRPGKKTGRPVVEDYQGQRSAGAIQEAVMSKINNHVTRVSDKDLDSFLEGDKPKAILFTSKGTTSALLRSIAIDFLDVISVAQIRDKETAAVKKFGVDKFPALVLIPGEGKDHIVYDGELVKKDMIKFLSQAGQPNPIHASGSAKSTKAKKDNTKSAKKSKATEAAKEQSTTESQDSTAESAVPSIIPISIMTGLDQLTKECLAPKSHTCVLVFTPGEAGEKAVESLSHLNTKYTHGGRNTFPLIAVPSDSDAASTLPKALGLKKEVNLIAINTRRNWWRQYEGDFSLSSVENWIDTIRMGEGAKQKIPEGVVVEETESVEEKPTQATDPEPEIETDGPEEVKTVIEDETETEHETQTETEAETHETAEPEAQPVAESEAEPKTKEEIKHEEL
ncbi:disulfide-isomerase [Fusarium heterosporum]|uniref:protein disulfide-isomerase n=1 Tax=Fusarium heterosporum TaxID=42747 RepID=A0A8H5WHT9_FUSHE|nr:disulfide-isomerase [Fusarium heterosporum]